MTLDPSDSTPSPMDGVALPQSSGRASDTRRYAPTGTSFLTAHDLRKFAGRGKEDDALSYPPVVDSHTSAAPPGHKLSHNTVSSEADRIRQGWSSMTGTELVGARTGRAATTVAVVRVSGISLDIQYGTTSPPKR